jgi:hypothetical protein
MYEKDGNDIDVLSGEVTSVRSTTKGKYYNDALKLCLSSKQHLNHLLSFASNISSEISKIKLPMIHNGHELSYFTTLQPARPWPSVPKKLIKFTKL